MTQVISTFFKELLHTSQIGTPLASVIIALSGSIATFAFWAKTPNQVLGIQWLTDASPLKKSILRQNQTYSKALNDGVVTIKKSICILYRLAITWRW